MNSKYSLEQLEGLAKTFKERVLPSAFDRRTNLGEKIQQIQQKNVLYGRSYFLMIYHLFFDEKATKSITHEDFMLDIFSCDVEKIEPLESLKAQVFLKTIKQLNNDSRLFATAIIESEPKIPINFFALSTFPALYGFFTSAELCVQASLLILDLLSLGASDKLLYPIVFAFFLSLYPFIEAMWNNFYTNFCVRMHPREDEISEYLAIAITECAPLISPPVFMVLRELLQHRPNLSTKIITNSFLPITFQLWHDNSQYAMGFGSGQEVLGFLNRIQNTQKAVMISALFVVDIGRVDVYPSYIGQCSLSSEVLIFSYIDVKIFVDAFRPISDQIQLFSVLETAARDCLQYRFIPFSLVFFLSSNIPKKYKFPYMLDFPQISIDEPEADPIFESARHELSINPKIEGSIFSSDEFRTYSLTKDIVYYIELRDVQEENITFEFQYRLANDLQTQILSLRRLAFSDYFSHFFDSHEFPNIDDIQQKTFDSLLENDDRKLVLPVFIEAINSSTLSEFTVPNLLHRMYLSVTRSCIEDNWKSAGQVGRTPFVLRLVPSLSRRKRLTIGHYFYLLDIILHEIRVIAGQYYRKESLEDGMLTLIQTVIHSANTEVVIDIFLYFEKVAFRDPKFLGTLSFEQSKNWNLFFQMMWKTLEKDPNLIQQCMTMDVMQLSKVMRRNTI